MGSFKNPLEQMSVLKPVKPNYDYAPDTQAANDNKMFPRKIIDMEDGTQRLEDRTPEELMARAEHQRDGYWAMVGIYEALKKMVDEDTLHGKEYRAERKMVTEGVMDEIKLELPPEWESQLETLIAKALKISLNIHSNYGAMKSEFKAAIKNGTIDMAITRYAEEAIKAETSMVRYQQDMEHEQVAPRYDGTDTEATTVVFKENGQE